MRFLVVINMKGEFDADFMARVADDTAYSDRLRAEGIQEEIMMRDDLLKCWSVFNADSHEELQKILEGFPLYDRLEYEVHQLWDEETSGVSRESSDIRRQFGG